jgi:hypothetical protein
MSEKVLGYAEFGAHMHRDNGGKMKIVASTSVNKPLSIDGGHDETSKIAFRRYKIVEEEKAQLNGSTFYEKEVWNEQEGGEKASKTSSRKEEDVDEPETVEGSEGSRGGPSGLAVLKNFVDNLAADVRQHTVLILAVGMVAIAALAIAVVK